ncbi:hypothetical protein [Gordonia soli]|uniref:Uncharacterized protein n=1 Tax=Gordonia soli NBRC 108243 TaxID=1223545 RepID=M0QKX0_9ACTN|nr:hypothetical protein [Gordonia soli]GAC69208.1 hypothetical protein GS4_23_00020 [Gordonia soli NBRC 108243]
MTQLGPPGRWSDKTKRFQISVVVFAGFAVLCVNWAVQTAVRGELMTTAVAVGLGSFVVALTANAVRVRFRRSVVPRATLSDDATVIRPDARCVRVLIIGCFGLIVSGTLFAILAPLNRIDLELSGGQRLVFTFVSAFAVCATVPWLIRSAWRGGPRIDLSPEGVDFHVDGKGASFRWDDVVAIIDHIPNGKSNTGHPITIIGDSDRTYTFDGADSYTPGGAALFWFLRFYWLTPDGRAELAGGRAVERYLAEELPAI